MDRRGRYLAVAALQLPCYVVFWLLIKVKHQLENNIWRVRAVYNLVVVVVDW